MKALYLITVSIFFIAGCAGISYERGFEHLLATELQYALDEKAMEDAHSRGETDFPYEAGEKER